MIETTPVPPFHRKAIIGFVVAILAVLAVCAGLLPLPFTILLCYPPGFILGIVALVLGLQAQREIRLSNASGRTLALIAAWIGGLTLVTTLCLVTAAILVYPYVSEFIQKAWN